MSLVRIAGWNVWSLSLFGCWSWGKRKAWKRIHMKKKGKGQIARGLLYGVVENIVE